MTPFSSATFRNIWLASWTLLAGAGLLLIGSLPVGAAGPTTWTETWQDLQLWTQVGQNCFSRSNGYADGICQSAALQSTKKWSSSANITASLSMSGKQAPGSSTNEYFVGLTLWQRENSPNASNYLEIAQTRHVPPFTANTYNRVVGLASDKAAGYWQVKSYVFWAPPSNNPQFGTLYPYRLEWRPAQNRWNAYWQGLGPKWQDRTPFVPNLPVYIRLLCVSVGENTPNNGSNAACKFGTLTVTGTEV